MKSFLRYFALVFALCLVAMTMLGCDNFESAVQTGNTVKTVTVTFPEGWNVRQIATRLEEKGVCSASDFIAECAEYHWEAEYDFLPHHAMYLAERPYALEGYLFPDTYEFFIGEDPHSCIKRFLNNFERRITDQMISDCDIVDLSLDQVIILASIIERETNVYSESPKVSAVFHNRMNHPTGYKGVDGTYTGGYFQSDATKFYPYRYGEDIPEDFVSEYNTYNVHGLPKGPICCPSLASIKAAIYPDTECDALFFYTDKNSKHYYAVSYDEHLANIKYCKDNGLA